MIDHGDSHRAYAAGVIAVLVFCSCASSQTSRRGDASPTGEREGNEAPSAETDGSKRAPSFGTDPMGVAQRWAHDPPEDAPGDGAPRMRGWTRALVLRLVREREGRYRALVAESDTKEADAVILVIERRDGDWSVTDTERAGGDYLWPRM